MKAFDKVFKQYDQFIDLFNSSQEQAIKDALTLQGHEILLDMGGGTGRLAEYFSKSCQKVYVLDESPGMLSKVKANPKVVPILGDALATTFERGSIDCVILSDVLHHIEDQTGLIKEITRVLKKNGQLIIVDFEKTHIKTKLLRVFEYTLFGKLFFRTKQEVINLIKDQFTITQLIDKRHYFIIKGEKDA